MAHALDAATHKTLAEIARAHAQTLIDTGYSVEKTRDTAGSVYLVTQAGKDTPDRVTTDPQYDRPTACTCAWFHTMHENGIQSQDGVIIANTEAACPHLYLAFMAYRADKGDQTAAQLVQVVGENFNDFYQHEYDYAPKCAFGYSAA